MKKGYWVIFALMIFSVLVSIVLIMLMPDRVPTHYNAAGVVDRMGSRYENLLFPIAMILIGLPFIVVGKKTAMKRTEEIAVLATGISVMACLNIVFVVLMCKALNYEAAQLSLLLGILLLP